MIPEITSIKVCTNDTLTTFIHIHIYFICIYTYIYTGDRELSILKAQSNWVTRNKLDINIFIYIYMYV